MSNVISLKGAHRAPVSERSSMETLIITPEIAEQWQLPRFQRPKRVNDKVREMALKISREETIEGVITLGRLKSDTAIYLVDGQHRREAFYLSECPEVLADVRICNFANVAEMAQAFVDLNSSLARMKPDDILRGLEENTPALTEIRRACPFVSYDQIRRHETSPILSMSAVLRCWHASGFETPASSNATTTLQILEKMDADEVENLIIFLKTAFEAWGKDKEYARLWGALNLALCMWIYRRMVLGQGADMSNANKKKTARLTINQLKQCFMSLSADSSYVDWLVGRSLSERDRSPAYRRIRDVIHNRLKAEGKNAQILRPSWANY